MCNANVDTERQTAVRARVGCTVQVISSRTACGTLRTPLLSFPLDTDKKCFKHWVLSSKRQPNKVLFCKAQYTAVMYTNEYHIPVTAQQLQVKVETGNVHDHHTACTVHCSTNDDDDGVPCASFLLIGGYKPVIHKTWSFSNEMSRRHSHKFMIHKSSLFHPSSPSRELAQALQMELLLWHSLSLRLSLALN